MISIASWVLSKTNVDWCGSFRANLAPTFPQTAARHHTCRCCTRLLHVSSITCDVSCTYLSTSRLCTTRAPPCSRVSP